MGQIKDFAVPRHYGKTDGFERAMEFMFIEEMVKGDSGDEDEFAEDNDY